MANFPDNRLCTLQEACELLSVSVATGRNWMKSGRLLPSKFDEKNHPYFSHSFIMQLKEQLSSSLTNALKIRRNKTYISGTASCHSYIETASANHAALDRLLSLLRSLSETAVLTDTMLLCILRDCAEKLLLQSGMIPSAPFCKPLLQDLVSDEVFYIFRMEFPELAAITYTYLSSEDTLGFLYLSLSCLNSRKSSGSYYTPVHLAKRLIAEHLLPASGQCSDRTVLDPACGTGMFLLQLSEAFPLKNLHGADSNLRSIALARINLAMKYNISSCAELDLLYENITAADFLEHPAGAPDHTAVTTVCYDIILGNPPWGARLSAAQKEKYKNHLSCAGHGSTETYDLFVEQSLHRLSPDGILSFLLPEAVLYVKAHRRVRELLLEKARVLSVEYLGEAFENVHCPSIILTVAKTHRKNPCSAAKNTSKGIFHTDVKEQSRKDFCSGAKITTKNAVFFIENGRKMTADHFSFSLSEEESVLLNKIMEHPNCTTLKHQADFALGIITGNNSALLHKEASDGTEPVIKGSDISKYHINSCSGYIYFQPERFQQTAPERLYRAVEKLFYRFVSRELVFAYDSSGLLSLNSCNIVIPHIPGLSVKYILAVLNSGVAQFVFEKQFSSVKVLRSHIEALPIPVADAQTQDKIINHVNKLISFDKGSPEYKQTLLLLDLEMKALFSLNDDEYSLLLAALHR